MKINEQHWSGLDPDARWFFREFDGEPGTEMVLEVGSHDAPVANILKDHGFSVIGVDLREYDGQACGPLNYMYERRDWCDMPASWWSAGRGEFGHFVSLSAIEHFGMGTYGEGAENPFLDVVAMRLAWDSLRPGGVAWITVPFGKTHVENHPYWRIYDAASLRRLTGDFAVEKRTFFASGPCTVNGAGYEDGKEVHWRDAMTYDVVTVPHLTVELKLRKVSVQRRARDGR